MLSLSNERRASCCTLSLCTNFCDKHCYLPRVHSGDKRAPLPHNTAVTAGQAVARDLIKELQAWKQTRYAEWNESTLNRLDSIRMDQTGKLMDMDSRDGRIKLHYNEDLVVVLREVSVTADVGHSIWQHLHRSAQLTN